MSGKCICKPGIKGDKCDLCPDGSQIEPHGCEGCKCRRCNKCKYLLAMIKKKIRELCTYYYLFFLQYDFQLDFAFKDAEMRPASLVKSANQKHPSMEYLTLPVLVKAFVTQTTTYLLQFAAIMEKLTSRNVIYSNILASRKNTF